MTQYPWSSGVYEPAPLGDAVTPEQLAADIRKRHNLRGMHFFSQDDQWRVFGSRGNVAFQASVEEGRGDDIAGALRNLDERLNAGPINRGELPPWKDTAELLADHNPLTNQIQE